MIRCDKTWVWATIFLCGVAFGVGCDNNGSDDSPDGTTIADTAVTTDVLDTTNDTTTDIPGDTTNTTDTTEQKSVVDLTLPVTEPGPYHVGYRQESVVYTAPGGQGERRLRLAVWYPTQDTGKAPPKYLDSWVRDNVQLDATPLSPPATDLPVFVFSHGHQGFAEASWFLTEFLATHGFIVLAPDHTGNTLIDLNAVASTETYYLRPHDLSATLDWLETLSVDHPLYGLASTTKIAVGGHSFGGYTAFAAAGADVPITTLVPACEAGTGPSWVCASMTPENIAVFRAGFGDDRFRCALPMAPGAAEVLGPSGVGTVTIPVLLQTGNGDKSTPDSTQGDPYWAELSGPNDRRVRYLTGGHHTFSITCDVLPSLGKDDGCGDGFLPTADAYTFVNAYSLAFLRSILYNDSTVTPLLDGEQSLSPDVVVLFLSHGP